MLHSHIRSLPKVELHCHLEGILDWRLAAKLQRESTGFPLEPLRLRALRPVVGRHRFAEWFRYVGMLKDNFNWFNPILSSHIASLIDQNVRYSEIMVGAGLLSRDAPEAIEQLHALRAWSAAASGDNIQVAFLIAIGRNRTIEEIEHIAHIVMALARAGLIVGVALAGQEPGNRLSDLESYFLQFREAGLGIEIHAGEHGHAQAVWDALQYGHAHRIGHGLGVFRDEMLLHTIQQKQIHIEICVTSNIKMNEMTSIAQHPVGIANQSGLNFSINTDDPGAFECSMLSEYQKIHDTFDFGVHEFHRIYQNTFNARFGV